MDRWHKHNSQEVKLISQGTDTAECKFKERHQLKQSQVGHFLEENFTMIIGIFIHVTWLVLMLPKFWMDDHTSWWKLLTTFKKKKNLPDKMIICMCEPRPCYLYHEFIIIGPIHERKILLRTVWTSPELCSLRTRSTNSGNIFETYLLKESLSISFKIRKAEMSNDVLAANSSFLAEPSGRIQRMIKGFLTGLSSADSELAQFRYICKTLSHTETNSCSMFISLDKDGLLVSKSCKKLR